MWLKDMVAKMNPGSVIVDLAAEKGGNCDLTKPDQKIVTKNGVTVIGYTDFPSRMAKQSSSLYANNVRHLFDDLTPEKNGKVAINLEDDVIRGALVTHGGKVMYPPPAPKVKAVPTTKNKDCLLIHYFSEKNRKCTPLIPSISIILSINTFQFNIS